MTLRLLFGLVFVEILLSHGTLLAQTTSPPTLVIQALDKVTARVSVLKIALGEPAHFGTLTITSRSCYKAPEEEAPEVAAFLEVVEDRADEEPVTRFSGWMFASSPALSAMEHPVYDLVVLDCEGAPIKSFQNDLDPNGN